MNQDTLTLTGGPLLDAILGAAVDAIVVIDSKGLIQRVNPAFEHLFGYTSAELTGSNVSMLMPETEANRHDGYLRSYLGGGEAKVIGIGREVVAQRKDGSQFPIELAVGETADQLFVGLIKDISGRKALERDLRRREQELRSILENATVATATTDLEGNFLEANQACLRMTQYEESELLELGLWGVCHPDDRGELQKSIGELARGERTEISLERHRCVTKDGQIRFASLHVAAIPGPDELPERVVVQVVDRTAQVDAERREREYRERLAHMDRLSTLGEMAAGIAHEVNQPLGAISNYAQAVRVMLEKGTASPERLDDILAKVSRQAQRAGEVIRRLRALAKGREGERMRVRVNGLVRDVLKLAEVDARLAGVEIHLDLADDLPDVLADPIQIQQVVLNLMRNGMDAMNEEPADGDLEMCVATALVEHGNIEIMVTDRGPGISAEVEREIMSPFFTTKDSGMGMGLAISQSIAASHGGRLWFTRNEDGPGITFRLALPVLP